MTKGLVGGLLVAAVSAGGCGGGTAHGAALQVSVYPSDREVVTGRRLESLARQFEAQYQCTEEDTITVRGVAPQTYSSEGCGHLVVYQLQCRPGPYSQICSWSPIVEDLVTRAAADVSCQPDMMDVLPDRGTGRTVMGCGYSATYVLQCQGMCVWQLSGPIAQAGPSATSGGSTVTVSGEVNSYIQQ
jgi:hypothetical protein